MEPKEIPSVKELGNTSIVKLFSVYKINKTLKVPNFYTLEFCRQATRKVKIERMKAQIEALELVRSAMSDYSHIAIIDKKVFALYNELNRMDEDEVEYIDEDFQIDYEPPKEIEEVIDNTKQYISDLII